MPVCPSGMLPLSFLSLIILSDEPQDQNVASKCVDVSESLANASESTTSKASLSLDEGDEKEGDETEENKSREQPNLS
jgi:hypothetical protein